MVDVVINNVVTEVVQANVLGDPGLDGTSGWSPVLAIVADGARRVQQVIDWTGGSGTKPTTGLYVGAAGLTAVIADAINLVATLPIVLFSSYVASGAGGNYSTQFQQALDDIKAAGGGELWIDGGDFGVTNCTWDGSVDLIITGVGFERTRLFTATAAANILNVNSGGTPNAKQFEVRSLLLDGAVGTSHLLKMLEMHEARIHDIRVQNSGADGIYAERCYASVFEHIRTSNNTGTGLNIGPGTAGVGNDDIRIYRVNALSNGAKGIWVQGSFSGGSIEDCDAEGNAIGYQVDVGSDTQSLSVRLRGNYAENNIGKNWSLGEDAGSRFLWDVDFSSNTINPGTVGHATNKVALDKIKGIKFAQNSLNSCDVTVTATTTLVQWGNNNTSGGSVIPWGTLAQPLLAFLNSVGGALGVGMQPIGWLGTSHTLLCPRSGDEVVVAANILMTGSAHTGVGTQYYTGIGSSAICYGDSRITGWACAAGGGAAMQKLFDFSTVGFVLPPGSTTYAPLQQTSGPLNTSALAGVNEFLTGVFYKTPTVGNRAVDLVEHFLTLSADQTGGNVNTAQTWFPGGGATTITLPGSTSYEFEGVLYLARTAGTTSHTIGVLFGGSATLSSINYIAEATSTVGNVLGSFSALRGDAAASVVVTAASISATENNIIKVRGVIRINAGGTLIPQFIFSAAPGGAPTVKANSHFRLRPIGSNTVLNVGNWA